MLCLASNIKTHQVYDLESRPLFKLNHAVMDPDTGKALGFLLQGRQDSALSPLDIKLWLPQKIILQDDYQIHPTADLVRLHRVLTGSKHYLRAKVATKSGSHLGRVSDFEFDTASMLLTRLFVQKNFLGFINYQKRIIHRNNILAVKPNLIIVKDSKIKLPNIGTAIQQA